MINKKSKNEIAVFGGGCFWCTEAVFKIIRGIISVTSGYSGGTKINPTYEEVSGGKTGYIEVVQIEYNPKLITFEDILAVFFGSHDPTTMDQQGNDVGPQYRSAFFYSTEEQKKTAEKFIADINSSNPNGRPIVTKIAPLDKFYKAESYHQDYFTKNRENSYCELVINPKLEKVQHKFAELLKDQSFKN